MGFNYKIKIMSYLELEKLNYDELLALIENAKLLLESKKLEKERNEIKEAIKALVLTYIEKGGDREELFNSLTPSDSNETKTNTKIEGLGDVVLLGKENFNMGKDKISDLKIEEVLEKGFVNHILQEGNVKTGSKNFPDPEKTRVVNPRGILPCLTTGGSCLVDVKELETGASKTTVKVVEPAKSGRKKAGRKGVPVLQFTFDEVFVKEWESAAAAEVSLGMSHQSVGKAARGEHNHKAGKFLWYRKDAPEVNVNKAA